MVCLASLSCSGPDGDLPAAYRDIAVPGSQLVSPAARGRGRALFVQQCAICHGDRADGQGRRREGFAMPPRDFTNAAWAASVSPRRLYFEIREGRPGTPMPSWKVLADEDIWNLVAYVMSVGDTNRNE